MTENESSQHDTVKATPAQIKRLYAVLHSVNVDPKQFKKEQKISSFEALTRRQISDWITELEEAEAKAKDQKPQQDPLDEDIATVSNLVRKCMREGADIVDHELGGKDMTADKRGEQIQSIGALIYFKLIEPPAEWNPHKK